MSDKQLSTVRVPYQQASILEPAVVPLLKGNDDENLLCGGCSAILSEGVSEQTLAARFAAAAELLVRCPECGALNEVMVRVA